MLVTAAIALVSAVIAALLGEWYLAVVAVLVMIPTLAPLIVEQCFGFIFTLGLILRKYQLWLPLWVEVRALYLHWVAPDGTSAAGRCQKLIRTIRVFFEER